MDKKRYNGTGPTYEELARVVRETTGGNMTPEIVDEVLNRDMTPVADAWRRMSSTERAKLETEFKATGDREKAISKTLTEWDNQFNMPRKVIEYQTNRDIYNALKDVYDKSGGDWDMVYKVARYNQVPKDLMNKFVKDGQWTDYSVGDEAGSGFGAVARGATDTLYGGLANILTGGEWANVDVVPKGVEYEDQANTQWRAGIRQAEGYGRSLMESDPAMEIAGQLVGATLPLGVASKLTKGVKVSEGLTKAGRIANKAVRGAATGALFSVPESLTKESLPEFSENVAKNAALFGTLDAAFAGLGEGAGALRRGVASTTRRVVSPGENITKSFSKLKPVSQMSDAERARGLEAGWLKEDGSLNVTDYLAREHGMNATQTIDDLATVSKTNREVFNKLSDEVKDFNYKEALDKAAKDAIIPNAQLSRVNRLLKSLPQKLEKFSDDIIGYTEEEGVNLAQSMRAFNQQVKHELRSIRNPNAVEKRAIDQYLKDVETANMKQYMKKKLPSELKAVDKAKTMFSELARIFQITNPVSALRAAGNVMEDQVQRNYIRQLISGEEYRPGTVRRLLERIGRAPSIDEEKLYNAQQVINAGISKSNKGDK